MPSVTILNHGTFNAEHEDIVISRLGKLLFGTRNKQWMLNTGVGTLGQAKDRHYLPGWNTLGGIFWAKGLDKNVEDAVTFVKGHCQNTVNGAAATLKVNIAGHSRGSMTALKIAVRLREEEETKDCPVNLFLIDPVPGNLGWINAGMYKGIAIDRANVKHAYMILAESERRGAFKPYVDQTFLANEPTHYMDTIPGDHGGINASGAGKHESADVVLHHAVTFLREHGTGFKDTTGVLKNKAELLELYAGIMLKFLRYQKQGGATATSDRKLQVYNRHKKVGIWNKGGLEKNKFDGRSMRGMGTTVEALSGLQVAPEARFFANHDHKLILRDLHGGLCAQIERIEQANAGDRRAELRDEMCDDAAFHARYMAMGLDAREHFARWLNQLGARA
jgi:hypothetical protein